MKTRSLSILLIAAVVIAAVVVFVALLLSNERMLIRSPVLNQQPSIITWMEGRVEISPESGDRAVWTAAEIGMRVREGDSIRTGADSSADIRIHKDGVIRIGAETLVVLDELTLRHQTVNITKVFFLPNFTFSLILRSCSLPPPIRWPLSGEPSWCSLWMAHGPGLMLSRASLK